MSENYDEVLKYCPKCKAITPHLLDEDWASNPETISGEPYLKITWCKCLNCGREETTVEEDIQDEEIDFSDD